MEPPISDIDPLPVYAPSTDPADEVERRRAELVDWWAASGRAQTLDVGWLAFTAPELRDAITSGPEALADRMQAPRWFHGLDKTYGGHAANPTDKLTTEFCRWATEVRFHPAVTAARLRHWRQRAHQGLAKPATAATPTRPEPPSCCAARPVPWCRR